MSGWAQWVRTNDFNEELAERREHEAREEFADRLCISTEDCRDPFDIVAQREAMFGVPLALTTKPEKGKE